MILGKSARGKWKNLKDHFRKEYKRCATTDSGQEMSRWPYFKSMMFIKDQILHTVKNSLYLSDFQYQNIYPEVEMGEGSDENNKFDCLNIEYENQNLAEMRSDYSNQDENISDDKHFLLSLLPMFSTLPLDKKLKARIAIETTLLNLVYPDLNTDDNNSQVDQSPSSQKSTKTESIKRPSEDEHPKKKKRCSTNTK